LGSVTQTKNLAKCMTENRRNLNDASAFGKIEPETTIHEKSPAPAPDEPRQQVITPP
jgi:hypothetical protein